MKEALVNASDRRISRVLAVSRTWMRPQTAQEKRSVEIDPQVEERLGELVQRFPSWGYRRLWAWLRRREARPVNRKKVYRILKLKGWMVNQRIRTARPRVKGWKSITAKSDERWAMDLTHIPCGKDGWGHLSAIIDCHDRELVGYEFSLRGRANEAERALEEACLGRFGTLHPKGSVPILRSDNGLVFQSRRFRRTLREYRLAQEFITPYTPEQNGVIERFFRSLKEECTWLWNFQSFEEARRQIAEWIRFYNEERPHQALGYLSPKEFRAQKLEAGVA